MPPVRPVKRRSSLLECIDLRLGNACTLNEWRFLLRSYYDVLRPFLSPTGQQASAWCCPVNGRKQKILAEEGGSATSSSGSNCSPCVELNNIPSEDFELWKFCLPSFANHLCARLGLHADPKLTKRGILHLGALSFRSDRLPAFLLKNSDTSYQARAQAIVAKQTGRCLFFTPHYCPDTEKWLGKLQHGYFPLEDLLLPGSFDPSPAYWQTLQEFKSSLPPTSCRPASGVLIHPDFKRINYPDGYVLNLAKAHKRRAVVRFIHEQLTRSGKDEFDIEVMREEFNRQHPDKPWNSDRFREDLFRNAAEDFDRLFDIVAVPLGRYRLKF